MKSVVCVLSFVFIMWVFLVVIQVGANTRLPTVLATIGNFYLDTSRNLGNFISEKLK